MQALVVEEEHCQLRQGATQSHEGYVDVNSDHKKVIENIGASFAKYNGYVVFLHEEGHVDASSYEAEDHKDGHVNFTNEHVRALDVVPDLDCSVKRFLQLVATALTGVVNVFHDQVFIFWADVTGALSFILIQKVEYFRSSDILKVNGLLHVIASSGYEIAVGV